MTASRSAKPKAEVAACAPSEFPTAIGELSRERLEHALDVIEQEAGTNPRVRLALGVIRLVTDFPREAPWYGKPIPSLYGDHLVEAGVVLRNVAETLEGYAHVLDDPVFQRGARRMATRCRLAVKRGRHEYHAYLDGLFKS